KEGRHNVAIRQYVEIASQPRWIGPLRPHWALEYQRVVGRIRGQTMYGPSVLQSLLRLAGARQGRKDHQVLVRKEIQRGVESLHHAVRIVTAERMDRPFDAGDRDAGRHATHLRNQRGS